MREMHASAAQVRLFSDDGDPVPTASLLRRALEYARAFDGVIIEHAEDPSLRDGFMHEGEVSALLGLRGIPAEAEEICVLRDIVMARMTEGRLHVAHLSTAGGAEAVRRAKAADIRVTCEVTPHHIALTDDAVRSFDASFKVAPPLRSQEHVDALKAAIADGTVDAIATDHAPHARHEKEVPFEEAPFGVTGLETAFSALYTDLVEPGVLPLELVLERMSAGPARAYGLDEPRIAVGAPANLVLLDLDATWRVTEAGFRSRSANSWLLGRRLRGKVRATIAAGRLVFSA
jgi:dihydroorotase